MVQTCVLFLVPYPQGCAPSQRFRVEQFLPVLKNAGIQYTITPFWDTGSWHILYKKGYRFRKGWGMLKGFCRRLYQVGVLTHRYTHVFIHREAAPLGPPFFEWIIARVLRKKIIYDFDDAIWMPNTSAENKWVGWIKWFGKVKYISHWSYKVAAGNAFLASWAAQHNREVTILPTCVDITAKHNRIKNQDTAKVTIGWTGSHSTLKYLNAILPCLQEIAAIFNGKTGFPLVDFVFIANEEPHFALERMRYLPWNEKTEINDLLELHIGLMPLAEDAWSQGKCGFKLIQYLGLGIPAVASPIGVNKEIIENGINGFLCITAAEWRAALQKLVTDCALRETMGAAGREKIKKEYSVQAHETRFLSLFD